MPFQRFGKARDGKAGDGFNQDHGHAGDAECADGGKIVGPEACAMDRPEGDLGDDTALIDGG